MHLSNPFHPHQSSTHTIKEIIMSVILNLQADEPENEEDSPLVSSSGFSVVCT